MQQGIAAALTVHVVGFTLWMGGLLSVAILLVIHGRESDVQVSVRLGEVTRRLAMLPDIGATFAMAGGLYLLFKESLFSQAWMLIKLMLVAVILILHGWIRVKTKHASQGPSQGGAGFPAPILAILALVFVAVVALAAFKPTA